MMKPLYILLSVLLLTAAGASAQNNDKIEAQKRVIAALEKKIANEEQEIARLKKGRAATEERVGRLARQIESRNQLLEETEKQAGMLREEIARKDSVAENLSASLTRNREQYAAMVREAWRNYRHNDYLTYIFSARDFRDVARRIAALREMASLRERKLHEIADLSDRVRREKEELDLRNRSLDSVTRKLASQKQSLERDARNARASIRQLSQRRSRPCSASSHRSSSWTWPSTSCASSRRATRPVRRSRPRRRDCACPWPEGA